MSGVDVVVAGRTYRVACREGEEAKLRRAAELVDQRSREVLAGLGAMSETRQLLISALLIAAEMIEKGVVEGPAEPDPLLVSRVDSLASRLESLADTLEKAAATP